MNRLAARISASAEDARDHAHTLASRCMWVEWESAAADRFRGTTERDVAALRRAADELDEAAQLLRQHAERVRERLAQIRVIEHAVTSWFADQARQMEWAAVGAWTPHDLPAPGDKQWLEVEEFLRRRGVFL